MNIRNKHSSQKKQILNHILKLNKKSQIKDQTIHKIIIFASENKKKHRIKRRKHSLEGKEA